MIELERNKRMLYQWDQNQRVHLIGYEPGTRVEFFRTYESDKIPLPVAAYEEDGQVYAPIPNILLQRNGYISVNVRPSADGTQPGLTKDFRVTWRKKPEDYEYSETELLKTVDEIVAEMKADPKYAVLLDEITRLNLQCKQYAELCNKILLDCERIKKEIGGKA